MEMLVFQFVTPEGASRCEHLINANFPGCAVAYAPTTSKDACPILICYGVTLANIRVAVGFPIMPYSTTLKGY